VLRVDLFAHEQAASGRLPIDLGQQRSLVAKTVHPRAQGIARFLERDPVLGEERVEAPARDDVEDRLVSL
jgi:hypothetical protein